MYEAVPDLFEEIVRRTASAFDCETAIDFQRNTRPVVNDPAMTEIVREVAIEAVGLENIIEEPTMGAEDFSEFLHHVPGCFFFLGSSLTI